MDDFDAIMIAEGERDVAQEHRVKAWQHLIDTGLAWKLQGWFGRRAADMIREGVCKPPQPPKGKE